MLMKDPKKNLATVVVSKMVGKPVEEPQPMDEKLVAAEEIMAALEAKDSVQFKEALSAFIELCMSAESEDEYSEVED